jgi:16S rRNA (cytidine1402-2'-O)-methyltransferase
MLELDQIKYRIKEPLVSNFAGKLFVVATPIGHRKDISERALETLQRVELIAAEDTRHTRTLLQGYGIEGSLLSFHDHNEQERLEMLLARLESGDSIALVSDAGTPLISDPGYRLVRAAQDRGIAVHPIPGASSPIAALSVSGLPTDRFLFEGFLPFRATARLERLKQLKTERATLVFLESCHRILETLRDCEMAFGAEREAVIARELTKMYETVHRAPLGELLNWVKNDPNQQRGELVLLVAGESEKPDSEAVNLSVKQTLEVLLKTLSLKESVALAVQLTGCKRKMAYSLALEIQKEFQSRD